MKCETCGLPMMFMGVVSSEGLPTKPELGFMCVHQHRKILPFLPQYSSWLETIQRSREQLVIKLRAAGPIAGTMAMSVDEMLAEVVQLVIDRRIQSEKPAELKTKPAVDVGPPDKPGIIIYCDGSCHPNPGPGGWGFVATSEDMQMDSASVPSPEPLTNNEAEYRAVIAAMTWAHVNGHLGKITIRSDSEIVVNQINGVYDAKEPRLADLRDKAKALSTQFNKVIFEWIPGDTNPAHNYAEAAYKVAAEAAGQKAGGKKRRK